MAFARTISPILCLRGRGLYLAVTWLRSASWCWSLVIVFVSSAAWLAD